jgi:hypothetical protein
MGGIGLPTGNDDDSFVGLAGRIEGGRVVLAVLSVDPEPARPLEALEQLRPDRR